MLPTTTKRNMGNRHLRKSVLLRKFRAANAIGTSDPNRPNIIFRYFGQMARRASTKPSFVEAVLHVFSMSSEKKMFRLDARWIIATVQYVQSIWYRPEMNHPRSSVRKDVLDDVFLSLAPKGNAPIPVAINVPCPNPAQRILSDVSPKPFVKWGIFMRLVTRLAAELTSLAGKWGKYASAF